MAIISKLRPGDTALAKFATTYASYRPFIQRGLTSGFVIYVLATTYRGLSARPSRPSNASNQKGKGADGKSPRVAVGINSIIL